MITWNLPDFKSIIVTINFNHNDFKPLLFIFQANYVKFVLLEIQNERIEVGYLIEVTLQLPIEFDRQKIREIIESMYPAPKDERGDRLYSPNSSSLFSHESVVLDQTVFQSSTAGDEREVSEKASHKGRQKDVYTFDLFRGSPVVTLQERDFLHVILKGKGKTDHETGTNLILSISVAQYAFQSRKGYRWCMLSRDGLTFHELDDLIQSRAASRFAGELLRRLQPNIIDDMLTDVSLAFDWRDHNNLIARYIEQGEFMGRMQYSVKTLPSSISRVIDLADAFGSNTYDPTILYLFAEATQEDKPKSFQVINHVRAYLRNQEEMPLPSFLPQ